jgi:uncharacterized protein
MLIFVAARTSQTKMAKIAIISDIHNNEVNLKKVLDFCAREKIGTIICCGDLASQETLYFVTKNFSGDFYYTFGNMDDDYLREFEHMKEYENVKMFPKFGELEIAGRRIAFVHYPNIARQLAESERYDFVFHGHTHKPWEEIVGNCKILNPGNVAGELFLPTFAVWNMEDDKFELIRVHDLK